MDQVASKEMPISRKSRLTLTPAALSQLLGPWMHGKGSLRVRLKGAVEKAIVEGLIVDGTRLPSERRFAEEGGVSRNTIVSAYDMLEENGLLERRRGSTSIVRTAAVRSAQPVAKYPKTSTIRSVPPVLPLWNVIQPSAFCSVAEASARFETVCPVVQLSVEAVGSVVPIG